MIFFIILPFLTKKNADNLSWLNNANILFCFCHFSDVQTVQFDTNCSQNFTKKCVKKPKDGFTTIIFGVIKAQIKLENLAEKWAN